MDRLEVLAAAINKCRGKSAAESRTGKLIAGGLPKMAQKLIEEAAEVAIDGLRRERAAVIQETADLLYNLTVLLTELGIEPAEIWAEMDRRHALFGIAEKLPKGFPDRE
jgi:phosphoribosyl-ATP pyrophosphohydrolase